MRKLLTLLPFLLFLSCHNGQKPVEKKAIPHKTTASKPADNEPKEDIQYSEKQLVGFLDSIGQLPTQPLADIDAFQADSAFRSPIQMDTALSLKDLNILKRAALKGVINVNTAKRIFKNKHIDIGCTEKSIFLTYKTGLTPVLFYSFDKNKHDFDEYALCIGDPDHCDDAFLYFFKKNKIISRHNLNTRFGSDLKFYKDTDGKTVVYYGNWFSEGSGIWWFNYYFYKYYNGKLIPVLNELGNGNMQEFWGLRILWLESTIIKTNPLTMKMVYYQQFDKLHDDTDKTYYEYGPRILDDSTIVKYTWDEKSKTLQGQYQNSKINKAQILSYYLEKNDLLYINAYYKLLKASLFDNKKRQWTLDYLNKVKNYYQKK